MEKVVSSLVRRSFRPMSNYAYVKLNWLIIQKIFNLECHVYQH
jgi:hypothetical protein